MEAVLDTGCQRSAIGSKTLSRIANALPDGLRIQYQPQSFRFKGVGGETITREVAVIPVCFGDRPGQIRAAILEDTADAPFLISLPIMKALGACIDLERTRIQYHSLQSANEVVFNERGQLCIKLFEFHRIQQAVEQHGSAPWKPQKVIADECSIFFQHASREVSSPAMSTSPAMPRSQASEQLGVTVTPSNDKIIGPKGLKGICPSNQSTVESIESVNHAIRSLIPSASQVPPTQLVLSSQVIAEASQSRSFVCQDGGRRSSSQALLSRDSRGGVSARVHWPEVVSPDRPSQDPPCMDRPTASHDRPGFSHDDVHSTCAGNDGFDGSRLRGPARSPTGDLTHGSGTEEYGARIQKEITQEPTESYQESSSTIVSEQQQVQLRDDPSRTKNTKEEEGTSTVITSIEPTIESVPVLLWTGCHSDDLSKGRTQLQSSLHEVPKDLPGHSMRLLHVDRRDQGRGSTEVAAQHSWQVIQEERVNIATIQQEIQKRISELREQRLRCRAFPRKTGKRSLGQVAPGGDAMRTPLESSRLQLSSDDASLSTMRAQGGPPLQDEHLHPDSPGARSRSQEEVRAIHSPEIRTLKSGERKRILGLINQRIQQLEQHQPEEEIEESIEEYENPEYVKQIMNLRLIGEVFSPPRFSSRASRMGLQAGKSFDLELGHQLLDADERQKCLRHLRQSKYGLVIISPPCEMFSLLQYLGINRSQESCHQDPVWMEKRRQAEILLCFAVLVCIAVQEYGGVFLFEQPWSAQSWRHPCVSKFLQDESRILVRGDQCCFGQSDASGNPIRKRTGFVTNCREIAKTLNKGCPGNHVHQPCMGSSNGVSRAKGAAKYTKAMVDAVLRAYLRYLRNHQVKLKQLNMCTIMRESSPTEEDQFDVLIEYRMGPYDDSYENPNHRVVIDPVEQLFVWGEAISPKSYDQFPSEVADSAPAEPEEPPSSESVQELDPPRRRQLLREIDKTHKGLGHPCQSRFLRILKMGGASQIVQELAKTYRCSQCEEDVRPKPWRRAAPPRELQFNQVVGVDLVTVKHHQEKIKCLNMVCWGTRYQMVIPLSGFTSSDIRNAYRLWIKLFGPPALVKADLGREFQREFALRCGTDGSELEYSSLESPTQNAITEREGKSFKTMFSKTSLELGEVQDRAEFLELIDMVAMMKNRLTHRSGYSAIHRALGYTPLMPGDFMQGDQNNLMHASRLQVGDVALQRQAQLREAAGRAFFSAECSDAIARAMHSGPRVTQAFEVGQRVFFWSVGVYSKVNHPNSASRKPNHMFWHGPARILAVQHPTTLYLSFQGRLVKASPEQCRRCSSDEDASCSDLVRNLCIAREELSSSQEEGVIDIRDQQRPHQFPSNHPTGCRRTTGKQPPSNSTVPAAAGSQKRSLSDIEEEESAKHPRVKSELDEVMSEPYSPSIAPDAKPSDDDTIAMESDLEDELLLETWHSQVDPGKELKLKDLSQFDVALFHEAIKKEWDTNLANGAIKIIQPQEALAIRQTQSHRIMQSRMLHVAKAIDDLDNFDSQKILQCSPSGAPCKAKSRWVARGDKDPDVFCVPSSSPVVHRDTLFMGLQAISSMQWQIHFADFSQAFMQGSLLCRDAPLF